jgi:hypothetical protein
MAYSVDDMIATVAEGGGIAQTSMFRVILPSIKERSGRKLEEFNLICTGVNIPGKALATVDRMIGPNVVQIVNGVIYADVELTFMVLNDFGIKNYFDTWMDLAYDNDSQEASFKSEYIKPVTIQALRKGVSMPVYQTSLGIPKLPSTIQNRLPKIGPFDFAQGELDLDFLTKDDITYAVDLEDAFCTGVSGIDFDNEADGIASISISLSYTKWKSTTQKVNPLTDAVKMGLGSLASRLGQLV